MDTCATQTAAPLFTGAGMRETTAVDIVSWGQVAHTAAGGIYQLCWCRPLDGSCNLAEKYTVRLGELALRGPAPLRQDRTCVTGQLCRLEGIVGHLLTSLDQVMVLDTCGVAHSIPRFSNAGLLGQATETGLGASFFADLVPETSVGGIYRLCWCGTQAPDSVTEERLDETGRRVSSLSCLVEEHFRTDLGQLLVVGPGPPQIQGRTCVSGRDCTIWHMLGSGLADGDKLLLLDTCSLGLSRSVQYARLEAAVPEATHVEASGAIVDFGLVTAPGGLYRLCWCGAGFACVEPEHFRSDAGEVTLVGPSPLGQARTCVSGRTCRLDGLLGESLHSLDQVLVLETCGAATVLPRFTGVGTVSLHPEGPAGVGAVASWGSGVVTGLGGEYRLCWCSGQGGGSPCGVTSSFRVDMGRFTLVGPSPLAQSRTCVSGQTCAIDGITGTHLAVMDNLAILDTCGMESILPLAGYTGQVSVVTEHGARAIWGPVAHTAAGGLYRLCWCAGLSNHETEPCANAAHFQTDLGSLTLIGPAPLAQHRTCVAGHTCRIDGLLGESLQSGDKHLVMDTCGVSSLLERSPFAGVLVVLGEDELPEGAESSHGPLIPTLSGGQYRLCWCARGMSCSTAEAFRVDMGELLVRGPILHQSFTCLSGQTCHIDGIQGTALSEQDSFAILDTCGERHKRRKSDAHAAIQGKVTNDASMATLSGASVSWDVLTYSGGIYRLCWCARLNDASGCAQGFRDFHVDVGAMHLAGPLRDQHYTCVSGRNCHVEPILGLHLSNDDRVLVLDTCGVSTALPRFSHAGLVSSVSESGALVHFDVSTAFYPTAAGGQYRLCWCGLGRAASGEGPSCAEGVATQFRSDLGELVIVGTAPLQQDRTCISGLTCNVDGVLGRDLANNDRLMLLETCGIATMIDGMLRPGVTWDITQLQLMQSGAATRWGGHAVLRTGGGQYRLCWCSDVPGWSADSDSTRGCAVAKDYRTDAGTLTVLGPAPLVQHRTCVSGRTCKFDGIVGTGLRNEDRFMILDTCGLGKEHASVDPALLIGHSPSARPDVESSTNESAFAQSVQWGTEALVVQGGQYRLCWCPYLEKNLSLADGLSEADGCFIAEEYQTDLGKLHMIGASPLTQDRTCISGQTCTFHIFGQDLSPMDSWLVFDTCGQNLIKQIPQNSAYTSFRSQDAVDALGSEGSLAYNSVRVSWGAEPVTAYGGEYRLCWCSGSSAAPRPADNATDFRGDVYCHQDEHFIEIGKLMVTGPSGMTRHYKISRGFCHYCGFRPLDCGYSPELAIDFQNNSVQLGGRIYALPDASLDQSGFLYNQTLESCQAACSETPACELATFDDKGDLAGMCILHEKCVISRDSSVTFDALLLVPQRPNPIQDRTCVSGQTCALAELKGYGLSESDSFLVLDTCGVESGVVPRLGGSYGGQQVGVDGAHDAPTLLVSWGANWMTSQGGIYRLCWCGHPTACDSSEEFRTDSGMLMVVGPAPLLQGRTCISGQTCVVDGVLGTGIEDGDHMMVMDTCGDPATFAVRGFPASGRALDATTSGAYFSWGLTAVTAASGQYRMCWCSGEYYCTVREDFRVDMGELLIKGPPATALGGVAFHERTCITGQTCVLSGLFDDLSADSDTIMIMASCGVYDGLVSQASRRATGQTFEWPGTIFSAPGGRYRMCWCTRVDANTTNTDPACENAEDFRTDFGELTLVGPDPNQHFTCVAGQTCRLDGVEGQWLDAGDRFLILDSCGDKYSGH